MGLDMYAHKTKEQLTEVDFACDNSEEFFYWRKHPDLHGWMEKLYYKKGGTAEDFNCVNVRLNKEDLLDLKNAINGESESLETTTGFFFGSSSGDNEEKENDLKFINEAISYIEEGNNIYYTSWW